MKIETVGKGIKSLYGQDIHANTYNLDPYVSVEGRPMLCLSIGEIHGDSYLDIDLSPEEAKELITYVQSWLDAEDFREE